jgi:dipeptidyl-peptidase-4
MNSRSWRREAGRSKGVSGPQSRAPLPGSNRQNGELETGLSHWKQTIEDRSNRQNSRGAVISRLRWTLVVVLAAGFGGTPAHARPRASKSLTVERIYSSPSLNGHLTQGIEWSPDGKHISYLKGAGSSEEMWTMDATTGKSKVLVKSSVLASALQPEKASAIQATGLGRLQAKNYEWSPSSDALLFTGSSSLAILDLKTMAPKPLVSGGDIEDPKFSPDGKWVSYVRSSNLWVVNLATGASRALTTGGSEEILKGKLDWVYPEELDATTAYWWSPDSSKIAYYEMDERPVTRFPITDMSSSAGAIEYTRFPVAGEANPIVRVGVVSIDGGETKWMDTGADTDVYLARVVWLHDGKRVAIERLNRTQNRLDLLFCDAATGTSQTILTETDKFWINVADDLYFFSDDKRFLWSSERTGFRHYYLYDLTGRQLEQLTSGDWGITGNGGIGPGTTSHPAVDEARGFVYFLSNKDDVRETDLYRLSLQDKSVARITREPGTHEVLISLDTAAFVDTRSDAMTPPRQNLDRLDDSRVAAIDENKVPELGEYHLSPVEFLDVPADDGTRLGAEMTKPPDFNASRKYPVLIFVYGGPQEQEVRNTWGGLDSLWHEMMAEKGYIIFTLDNRGSSGRGHMFETPIYHQFAKVELQDQLAGVKYLKSLPYVDRSRIGIWGWSYGGYMTLEALFNAPDVFKAGISVSPVSDWRLYDTIYTERYMGRPQENPDGYKNSSPVNQASNLRGKLMLVHATGDDNVHFVNTSELINTLIDSNRYPAQLMIFPGRGHSISDWRSRIQLFERMTEFLLNNL